MKKSATSDPFLESCNVYRVATLFCVPIIVKRIAMPSLKSLGHSYMPELTESGFCYQRMNGRMDLP